MPGRFLPALATATPAAAPLTTPAATTPAATTRATRTDRTDRATRTTTAPTATGPTSAAAPTTTPSTETATTPATDRTGRQVWADVAKGVSILLVVLHHATTKHYLPEVPAELAAVADGWSWLTSALKPVRMPLFFVVGGIFAARAVQRPWSDSWRRVASPYYLYVVWLLVLGAVFAVERTLPMNRTQDLGELVQDLVWASTGVWFLYALAVYFLVARLTRALPTPVVLVAATAVGVAGALAPIEEVNRQALLLHLVHFLVGTRLPAVLRGIAELGGRSVTALVVSYLLGTATVVALPVDRSVELLLLSVLGVPAGLALAGLVARRFRAAAPLAWIGQRTLSVYVLHMPVLAVVQLSGLGPGWSAGGFAPLWVAAYPVLVTVLVVVGSLVLHRVLVAAGLPWLFAMPELRTRPQAESASAST